MLVGSLLVGRQIVDRAKIQRYLFELDYYEKNFHMFFDTYRTVLGHLTAKTCKKYSKFNALGCDMCNYIPDTVKASKLMESDINWYPYGLYTSEYLIEFETLKKTNYYSGTCNNTIIKELFESKWASTCVACSSGSRLRSNNPSDMKTVNPWGHWGWIRSSINSNIIVRFTGFNFTKEMAVLGKYQDRIFTASNKAYNTSLPHELDNAVYRSYLDLHNVVYFDTYRDLSTSSTDAAGSKITERNNASFSAKMASELDAKVDDGRPGSGKILALKGGAAHNANTSEAQHKKVCYDQMADQVDKAIYETSTDIKYGCNIIKVMEDVK